MIIKYETCLDTNPSLTQHNWPRTVETRGLGILGSFLFCCCYSERILKIGQVM